MSNEAPPAAAWSRDIEETPGVDIAVTHIETKDTFVMPLALYWRWYEAIALWGFDAALELAVDSASLVAGPITEVQRIYLRQRLEAIAWRVDHLTDGPKEEGILEICYLQLRLGGWTRKQALRFAQNVLDRSLTDTAWRLRLMRFAKKSNLPALGTRGRPRKQE